jgi:DNA invertase Pin-like site-specific DNA recombinase
MATINYIRVSTASQNTDRQLVGIKSDKTFIDKCSGKDINRPEFNLMMEYVREGDQINVHELSRLARNTRDLLEIVSNLNKRGISVRFVKENLQFTGDEDPFQSLMLTMLGAISTFERDLLLERQREGIAIARQKGKYRGRISSFTSEEINEIRSKFNEAPNKARLAREYGISRSYLYKLVSSSPG